MTKPVVWRWETRILVALPVICGSLALVVGILAIELMRRAVVSRDPLTLALTQVWLLAGGTVLSAGFGLLAAVAIVRPVRRMIDAIRAHASAALPDAAPANEVAALAQALQGVLDRFEGRPVTPR